MDSCHIFNFLFGTRKATSEFTKCFSSTLNTKTNQCSSSSSSSSAQKSIVSTCDQDGTNISTTSCGQPHSSPLKQIQQRLASLNLTSKFRLSETKTAANSKYSPVRCETYRPTLADETPPPTPVESISKDGDTPECRSVAIIENPTCPVDEQPCSVDDGGRMASFSPRSGSTDDDQTLVERTQPQSQADDLSPLEQQLVLTNLGDDKVRAELCRVDNYADDKLEQSEQVAKPDKSERQLFRDKKSERVRNLVQSFELSSPMSRCTNRNYPDQTSQTFDDESWQTDLNNNNNVCVNYNEAWRSPNQTLRNNTAHQHQISAILNQHQRAKPPRTPPKSVRAKCFNWQLMNLKKPLKVEQLFQDEQFLSRLFDHLEPLDRCAAAQVCRNWRAILYSKQSYWKDLINVIDCTQLRREQLIECIMNTLHQSAKLKQQQRQLQLNQQPGADQNGRHQQLVNSLATIDQDEVWRIQELCNRYSRGYCSSANQSFNLIRSLTNNTDCSQQQADNFNSNCQQPTNGVANSQPAHNNQTSKSCSIPSQISSSTLSSISISSLLSPLSESSRVDSMREKLYHSIDDRGFDAICLFGATDEDIEDMSRKTPPETHKRILVAKLNNCCISDRGLEAFLSAFNQLNELELSGCNEITNSIDLKQLSKLEKLTITDCTNISDGFAQKLIPVFHQLSGLTIQSYHLTDSFLDYVSLNSDTHKMTRLELPNCKEITDQSMLTIAKHFPSVQSLSISGSTKISDDGIEILTEHAKQLRHLDLSWCTKITDASLECIACDLTTGLRGLVLDRNVHITDIGLGYLSTMTNLELVHIRWCSRVTDLGLESLFNLKSLRYLSLAGLNQITARSLLCLIDVESLVEVELTNCCAVNAELLRFLGDKMPKCNIIF